MKNMKTNWLLSVVTLSVTALSITTLGANHIFDDFIPSMLSADDKILFDQLQLSIATLEKTSPKETLSNLYCFQKSSQAKIELLATIHPLTTELVQHLQLQALKNLCTNLHHGFDNKKLNNKLKTATKKTLKETWVKAEKNYKEIFILGAVELASFKAAGWLKWTEIPETKKGKFLASITPLLLLNAALLIKRACTPSKNQAGQTEKEFLAGKFEHFSYDYYTAHPQLYNAYIEIIKQYRTGEYTQSLNTFLKKLDDVTAQHETEKQESSDAEAVKIISLFQNNLLKVKNEILDLHPYESNPKKTDLWLSYITIKNTPGLDKLLTDEEFSAFYNSIQKITAIFIADTELPKHTVCELAATLDKMQKHLKRHELSTLFGLIETQSQSYMLISQMAAFLENIREYLLQTTEDPFIRALLNLSLISAKVSQKEPAGSLEKIFIGLAQQMSGQKFTNYKDMILYFATTNSPQLIASALKFVVPLVKKETKKLFNAIIAQLEDKNTTKETIQELLTKDSMVLEELKNSPVL